MIPNVIEREVLIDAPVEVVWRLVTEPEQIRQWFAEEAEVELRVRGAGRLRFQSGQSYSLQIEAVEPPRRFAFRWVQPEGTIVRAADSLLVEFILQPEATGSTRLRVVESGFDKIDWSDEKTRKYAEDHTRGWHSLLDRLREYAPAVR